MAPLIPNLGTGCKFVVKFASLSLYIRRKTLGRVQLSRDGTRWHTGGEVKGKLANGVGTLPRNMVYPALLPMMRTPRLPVVDWTDDPAHLNGLVRFAERLNLVSAHAPSHFKRSLLHMKLGGLQCIFGPCGRTEKSVVPTGFRTPDRSLCSLVTILTEFNICGSEHHAL